MINLVTHASASPSSICNVRDLTVSYRIDGQEYPALRNINFDILGGSITALIGESGSGKSTLGYAMLNGVPRPGRIVTGSIFFQGIGDIVSLNSEELRRVRGRKVGMVFQATQNTLNPLKRVGAQLLDLARSHKISDTHQVIQSAVHLAKRMSLNPDRVLTAYQHELSGGMRQRVNLIFALVFNPQVVILDEPTTALDVLSQSSVLQIIRDIQRERELTIVLITHDLGVVAEVADRVAVLYAGQIVEQGDVLQLLQKPSHPYTQGLISALPRLMGETDLSHPIAGTPPKLVNIPRSGCVFRERCPVRMDSCESEFPPTQVGGSETHLYACHLKEADR